MQYVSSYVTLHTTSILNKCRCYAPQMQMELRSGGRGFKQSPSKGDSSFLTNSATTLVHTISDSEKKAYVDHINTYLKADSVLQRVLPIDASTNQLFDIVKDGILLWYGNFFFRML